jgi:hypothetical protein
MGLSCEDQRQCKPSVSLTEIGFANSFSKIPDWWSCHQLNGRGSANCGNDPVVTNTQLNQVLQKYSLPSRPFQINEYASTDEQTPAYTAWFIERLESSGIVGMRANWGSNVGLHNDLAKLIGPGGSDKSSNFYKLGDWHVFNYYTKAQKGVITSAGATVSTCYDLYAHIPSSSRTLTPCPHTKGVQLFARLSRRFHTTMVVVWMRLFLSPTAQSPFQTMWPLSTFR